MVLVFPFPVHDKGFFIVPAMTDFTILALNYLCLVWVYLPTTTGPSVCHSLSLDKRKLFCLFVCRGTLSCYAVGAFFLSIPRGMHLVGPTQLCSFGWYVISTGHFPQKSTSRNLKIGFSPFPTAKPCPLTSNP